MSNKALIHSKDEQIATLQEAVMLLKMKSRCCKPRLRGCGRKWRFSKTPNRTGHWKLKSPPCKRGCGSWNQECRSPSTKNATRPQRRNKP